MHRMLVFVLAYLVPTAAMAQPWDLGRFARTTLFFNGPDTVLQQLNPLQRFSAPTQLRSGDVLWSAAAPRLTFGPLDDVVMGGVSESTFRTSDGVGIFSGTISTENNGGFAGCRSKAVTPALDLSSCTGLKLLIKGDGKLYKFIVRDSYDWNGIAWAQAFDSAKSVSAAGVDGYEEVRLPFAAFVPTLFARRVPGVKLNTRELNTVQLTLSKFEYDSALNPRFSEGAFELRVQQIAAY